MTVFHVLMPIPSLMTNRARVFLLGTSAMFVSLGYFLIFTPAVWASTSYVSIKIFPLWVWGALMVATAGFLFGSAWSRNHHAARLTLCVASVITALWTASFVAAFMGGFLAGPSGPIIWGFTTFTLLLQVWQPLRVPMEEVIERETRVTHKE